MQNLSCEVDKFGFLGKKEFIPRIFANLKKEQVAKIFLTLYNANVDTKYKIPPKFAKNCTNLNEIFLKFISENLAKKPLNFTKATKFCITSNLVIFSFLQGKAQPILPNLPSMKTAKIIFLLRNSPNFGIVFNSNESFKNFVFDKISFKNKNCKIQLNDEIIIIEKDGFRLGILPNFREITKIDAKFFNDDIKSALSKSGFKSQNIDMLYLVYPRNEHFKRHIEVKSCEFGANFTMKLVPYSINNKIF